LELEKRSIHWIKIMAKTQACAETTIFRMAFIVNVSREGAEAAAASFLSLIWVGYWVFTRLQEENSEATTLSEAKSQRFAACGIGSSSRWLFRRSTCHFLRECLLLFFQKFPIKGTFEKFLPTCPPRLQSDSKS